MENFALTVPDNITSEVLERDLDRIITKHDGVFAFGITVLAERDSPTNIRTYEIPTRGTVTTWTNEKNRVEAGMQQPISAKIHCSALVACTGFDERSPEYKRLAKDINTLQNYHNL